MKKMIIALVAMIVLSFTTANAMSYEQARQQALFLTDKMAYELNLTDDQYEAAYEVNLDYLMGVNGYDDLYGVYWRQRNMDLSYILLDWQYQAFLNASYFYRPLYWDGGYWHFGIYARYPRRDYFFFGRPNFYVSYRGGHSWRVNGGRSWYHGRQFGAPRPDGQHRVGMRDGFNRGDFGRGQTFGNAPRQSSTRTTVTRDHNFGNGNNTRPSSSNNRGFGNNNRNNSSVFGGNRNTTGSGNNNSRPNSKDFSPRQSNPSNSGSFGNRSLFGNNRSNGSSTGSSRNNSSSFGSGKSNNARSFGGGNTNSNGGNFGGGHFGGRR